MDSIVCRELLQSKTTPMYVFDMEVLEKRIAFLREHLPPEVDLCYAVKANPFLIKEISSMVELFCIYLTSCKYHLVCFVFTCLHTCVEIVAITDHQ